MMRRNTWITGGVGLVGVLATGLLVLAQSPSPVPPVPTGSPVTVSPVPGPVPQSIPAAGLPSPPPPIVDPRPQHASKTAPSESVTTTYATPTTVSQPQKSTGDLVQDLIQIINETNSVDTFFVTTKLLEEMGSKSRAAVPAIIRNAERLQVFKDTMLKREGDADHQLKSELGSMIIDALGKIMNAGQSPPRQPVVVPSSTMAPMAPRTPSGTPLLTPTSSPNYGPPTVHGSYYPPSTNSNNTKR
jgi:hypothetical protein